MVESDVVVQSKGHVVEVVITYHPSDHISFNRPIVPERTYGSAPTVFNTGLV